jgi:hypothetical protein
MISVRCSIIIPPEEVIKGQLSAENKIKVNEWKEKFENALTRVPTPTSTTIIVDIIELEKEVWIIRTNISMYNDQMDAFLKKYFPSHEFRWML